MKFRVEKILKRVKQKKLTFIIFPPRAKEGEGISRKYKPLQSSTR